MDKITIGSKNYGENLYRVYVGTGTAWLQGFDIYAFNEQDAVDLVANYCEEHELQGLYSDYYELADECEIGEAVDEYAESHNLISCGNHGVYMNIDRIEEVKNNE